MLLLSITFFVGGCAGSLHPVVNQKTIFFDPSLVGTWDQVGPEKEKSRTPYSVSVDTEEPNTYRISFVSEDKKTVTQVYLCKLFRLGQSTYFDIWFDQVESGEETYGANDLLILTPHLFGRVRISPDEIRGGALDDGWLERQLDDKKLTLPYVKAGDFFLLTGSPQQLRTFVSRYAEDADAFPQKVYKRRK
jgi:hypothetical protein